MKRMIKFYNKYKSDNCDFSTCSTEYDIIPGLYPDSAGIPELIEYAKQSGMKRLKGTYNREKPEHGFGFGSLTITDAVKLREFKTVERFRESEKYYYWLGFITIDDRGPLTPMESIDNEITAEQSYDILNNQSYGVYDTGEHVDGGTCLVIESWDFFHSMPLLGYPLESFFNAVGVDGYHGFSDDTLRCDGCYKFDDRDNGYTYNHRVVNDCELLGVNCGCYQEHCESNYMEYVNNHRDCINLETAESLESQGILEHVERFIGGMTDGRGGYYAGEYTRESEPETALNEYLQKNPDGQYIFTHDESGQFQTYFSIWKVINPD